MALLATAFATPSYAQPASEQVESIELQYRAPANCPARARFQDEVGALTPKAAFVEARPGIRRFDVVITVSGGKVDGKLGIDAGSEHSEREVSGKTCKEVVSALALATAIAVDPNLLGGPAPSSSEPPPKKTEAPATEAPERDRGQATKPTAERDTEGQVVFSGGIGGLTGVAPSLSALASVRGGYRFPGHYAPEIDLAGEYAVPVEEPSATFSALFLRPSLTWEPAHLGDLSLGGTFGVEIGQIKAEADPDLERPLSSDEHNWFALDLGVSGTWRLPAELFVRVDGGLVFPLLRHEYEVISPNNEPENVHTIPLVSARGMVLVGCFL